MNTYQLIKDRLLTARKTRNGVASSVLSTLLAQIEIEAKNDGQREVTENDCSAAIKKFIKNIDLTLKYTPENATLISEKAILSDIPVLAFEAVSKNDINASLATLFAENPDKYEVCKTNEKNRGWFVGQVMKHFNGKTNPATIQECITEAFA